MMISDAQILSALRVMPQDGTNNGQVVCATSRSELEVRLRIPKLIKLTPIPRIMLG